MIQKYDSADLDTNWFICLNLLDNDENLPPLNTRLLVTDKNTTTIAWIRNYKKGWEGWVLLDGEYLDDIIAWQYLPTAKNLIFL